MHRTSFISASLAAGLLAGGMTMANAVTVGDGGLPSDTVTIGNQTFTYTLTKGENGKLGFDNTGNPFTNTETGATLTLTITSDADPVITAIAAGTDPVGGTTFTTAVVIPSPFPAGTKLQSQCTISGSLTDGGNAAVGAGQGLASPGFFQDCTIDGIVVATAGPLPFAAPPPPLTPPGVVGGTINYPPNSNSGIFVCPLGGCAFTDLLISFTNTGGAGDSVAFTGSNVVTVHAPEPSVLALFGLGLGALGLARRRKVV